MRKKETIKKWEKGRMEEGEKLLFLTIENPSSGKNGTETSERGREDIRMQETKKESNNGREKKKLN